MFQIDIINGCFLRRSGRQEKPTILCLSGFADTGLMFAPLFSTSLAREFEVIAVDLPGFGASPRQPNVGTITGYGKVIVELARAVSPERSVGLVGHSIASAIAVSAVQQAPSFAFGLFSIEGNLTEEDAYFSGRAADWDDPIGFKKQFLNEIWDKAQSQSILRRYFSAAVMADPIAMWELGQDAKKISTDNAVGDAYSSLSIPNLYYWSKNNTPKNTQMFILSNNLANLEFDDASHWPTIDATEKTAGAIGAFFSK